MKLHNALALFPTSEELAPRCLKEEGLAHSTMDKGANDRIGPTACRLTRVRCQQDSAAHADLVADVTLWG